MGAVAGKGQEKPAARLDHQRHPLEDDFAAFECIGRRRAPWAAQGRRKSSAIMSSIASPWMVSYWLGERREERMGTVTIAPRSLSRELSVAAGKPMLRGIHHLALVTDVCG